MAGKREVFVDVFYNWSSTVVKFFIAELNNCRKFLWWRRGNESESRKSWKDLEATSARPPFHSEIRSLMKIGHLQLRAGVDVMIKIFCDFSQICAKKLAFFLNTNVMINCFQNLALFWVKNDEIFFAKFFGKNIFKIITSVPGLWHVDTCYLCESFRAKLKIDLLESA
jgi:hypothetical protein